MAASSIKKIFTFSSAKKTITVQLLGDVRQRWLVQEVFRSFYIVLHLSDDRGIS
jgi:hypothetical protein